jgi:hypothetical protein
LAIAAAFVLVAVGASTLTMAMIIRNAPSICVDRSEYDA